MVSKRNQWTVSAAMLAVLAACGSGENGSDAAASNAVSASKAVETVQFEGEAAQAATLAAVVKAAGGTDADVTELQDNVSRAGDAPLLLASVGQTVVDVLPSTGTIALKAADGAPARGPAGELVRAGGVARDASVAAGQAPYSVQGVSGALLATLLDQHAGNPLHEIGPTDHTFLVPVAARNGSVINDTALPMVTAGFGLTPANDGFQGGLPAERRSQLQMYMRVQNLYGSSSAATRPFGEFNMNTLLVSGAGSVSVGKMLHVMSWTPNKLDNGRYDRTGVPGVPVREGAAPVPFWWANLYGQNMPRWRDEQLVPYGSLVQQWSADNTYVQLWLLKNGSSSQPQLCWNFWLPNLKRTYCQAWQVPGGWQPGGALANGGNFVNDNRMAQGESGHLYWQQLTAGR